MKQLQIIHEASLVVLEHLGTLFGAKAIFLAENGTAANWIVDAWNRSVVERDEEQAYASQYCMLVCGEDKPACISDTTRDPLTMHLALTKRIGPRSFLGVPVRFRDGRRFGTICALDRPDGLRDSAIQFVEQAAVFLGALIDVEESLYLDELTDLYNRAYLEMFYEHLSADTELSAVFIDIDNCKAVNEAYGRPVGDAFLQRFAERLKQLAAGVGIPARYAGDEFMVLMFHRSEGQVRAAADKMYEQLTAPFEVLGHSLQITVSMGISMEGTTLADHIIRSDTAMYQIKKNGKEGIAVYEDRLEELIPENGLRRGVKYNSFQVLYQPILNARTGETAVEALIRLNHPELGLVGPNVFLPCAVQSGYLLELDLQTLQNACCEVQSIAEWRERVAKLAVNCDALALRRPEFPELVRDILRVTGFPAERLEFELNERISMFDLDGIEPQIRRLRALGVSFALDDFGQGYTTLGLLLKLPIQKVKLDRIFVESLPYDERSRGIVEGMISICDRLELEVVGEGIETKEQLDSLLELGSPWLQGYRIGKPTPIEELEEALRRTAYSLRAGSE